MILPQACVHCASNGFGAPTIRSPEKRDNLVWACRSCNSAKGATDAMEWLAKKHRFPPLLLLRRYLKLAIEFSHAEDILRIPLEGAPDLPFAIAAIPVSPWPPPTELRLWIYPLPGPTQSMRQAPLE